MRCGARGNEKHQQQQQQPRLAAAADDAFGGVEDGTFPQVNLGTGMLHAFSKRRGWTRQSAELQQRTADGVKMHR